MQTLARLRVPLGFALGALVLWLATPTPHSLLAGAPIAAAGEAIRFWAAGHVRKAREVTVSGPYRWMAHPLYAGSSLMGAGLAVACASAPVALLIAVYLIATLTAAMKREERFLRQAFGGDYDRYRRDTGNLAAARRFSFALAMSNREYRAVAGLALAVLLLAWKATYNEPFRGTAGPRAVRPDG